LFWKKSRCSLFAMKNSVWAAALNASADPQRAKHQLELLAATPASAALAGASAEQAQILCALFSGSEALSSWLIANPESISVLSPESLKHPRREQGLRREVNEWLVPLLNQRDYSSALQRLRLFKQREMMRIAARDLARLAEVTEITRELSDLADVCLGMVWQLCNQQLVERLGQH
jgi:glutamate-ammonia-ligase adenylyltransferase